MRTRAIAAVVAVSVSLSSLPSSVFAADEKDASEAKTKQLATDLFDKGVEKMEKGHCDDKPTDVVVCKEARDSFRKAYELYPAALGALRNLAYTEKGLGMVASAARDFRELARKAPLDPKPERQKWADFARAEVKALEPRIPHISIKTPGDHPVGLKIMLDGEPLLPAAWDTQIDVDPGDHAVHAEAPGRLSFEGSVNLAEKQTKTISVALDVDPNATTLDASGVPKSAPSRVAPLVVTVVGVVGVGVGLGLGYASMKKKDSACNGTKLCDPDGLSSGKSLANASTIVTSIGAAALVSGLVWYFLTPSGAGPGSGKDKATGTTVTPWASADGAGIGAIGSF